MKMATHRILFVILILASALIPLQAAFAKGPPVKVVITGRGINSELVITDPTALEPFALGRFYAENSKMSTRTDFKPDVGLGDGYRIDRYYVENSVWDKLTYYPDPEGRQGYIYLQGNEYPGMSSQGRGLWFRASPEGDAAMQQIITEHVEPSVAPKATASLNPLIIALLAVGLLVLIVSVTISMRGNGKSAPAM